MRETIETGDVVHLRSGGPLMTVDEVRRDNVVCLWFHEGDLKKGVLPMGSLKRKEGDA